MGQKSDEKLRHEEKGWGYLRGGNGGRKEGRGGGNCEEEKTVQRRGREVVGGR